MFFERSNIEGSFYKALVVKSVDTADLKSAAFVNSGRAGSIPAQGTKPKPRRQLFTRLFTSAANRVQSLARVAPHLLRHATAALWCGFAN